ncbi:MAG TPA: hypothetical protein VJ608_11925 [Albitalea sp.]|nr:hypothetical protein [Albitalea sp.]
MTGPANAIPGLVTTEELEDAFRSMYPAASDQELAARMACFLEEVPAKTVLDDGALTQAGTDDEWRAALQEWIARLKELAGNAYPPTPTRKADNKKER